MKHAVFSLLLSFICLSACNIDKSRTIELPEEISFQTTDRSRLFFRNVRQLYYDIEKDERSKRLLMRMQQDKSRGAQPNIGLCIVNDPYREVAYIMVEPNSYLQQSETIHIKWQTPESQQSGTLSYKAGNTLEQLQFATDLYNILLQQGELYLVEEEQQTPLLQEGPERDVFRKTMVDYYRLINLL